MTLIGNKENECVSSRISASVFLFDIDNENAEQFAKSIQINFKDTTMLHRRRSSVFIVNFEQIGHFIVVFGLLTLKN